MYLFKCKTNPEQDISCEKVFCCSFCIVNTHNMSNLIYFYQSLSLSNFIVCGVSIYTLSAYVFLALITTIPNIFSAIP
jgi:hypothetical protein